MVATIVINDNCLSRLEANAVSCLLFLCHLAQIQTQGSHVKCPVLGAALSDWAVHLADSRPNQGILLRPLAPHGIHDVQLELV
jgi:hypothetical protein